MADGPLRRGGLADEKTGASADADHRQPEAAEVESARQLENAAATQLGETSLSREDLRRLADEYVALDLGEDVDEFLAWAKRRHSAE